MRHAHPALALLLLKLPFAKDIGRSEEVTALEAAMKIAYKNTQYGIATVTVDGSLVATSDLYSPSTKYQQLAYRVRSLADTTHNFLSPGGDAALPDTSSTVE